MTVSDELAKLCGKEDWAGKVVLAANIADMLGECERKSAIDGGADGLILQEAKTPSKAVYAAEGEASVALKDKRAFELASRQNGVYSRLGNNDRSASLAQTAEARCPTWSPSVDASRSRTEPWQRTMGHCAPAHREHRDSNCKRRRAHPRGGI